MSEPETSQSPRPPTTTFGATKFHFRWCQKIDLTTDTCANDVTALVLRAQAQHHLPLHRAYSSSDNAMDLH
jgi:hypothetical protein